MIITKAHVAAFLQRQQLLHLLLHAAGDVLVYVDKPEHARAPERERKILNRPTDRKPCVGIFIIWLQVIHRGNTKVAVTWVRSLGVTAHITANTVTGG